jgi:hypothetical protein
MMPMTMTAPNAFEIIKTVRSAHLKEKKGNEGSGHLALDSIYI